MPAHISDLSSEVQAQIRAENPDPKGVARVDFGPKFRSDLERDAWREWLPTKGAAQAYYESLTFHLPSGGYKPDFHLIMPDGEIWLIEVKGWNKNLRADRRKFLEAASTHSWAHWCWLTRDRRQWVEEWH